MLGRKPPARRQHDRSSTHVLAGEPAIRPGLEPRRHNHALAVGMHILLHEDGVGTRRDGRAGEDADRRPRRKQLRGGTAGGYALHHGEPRVHLGIEIGMAHGIAVDGRIIEGGKIDGRDDITCKYATACGVERNGLDLRDRRDPFANDALDLVHSEQRSRKREAIVGELRHHPGPACAGMASSGAAYRIRVSAMPSISSRSTTGTRAAANGSSEAIATMAGSS